MIPKQRKTLDASLRDPRSRRARARIADGKGRGLADRSGQRLLRHFARRPRPLLEGARALGDVLVVGINSDAQVAQAKGRRRPILPERERAELVASLGR